MPGARTAWRGNSWIRIPVSAYASSLQERWGRIQRSRR